MPNATDDVGAGSGQMSTTLRVLANLWQNYGGVYGDYCVLINITTILLLSILRSSNCLPWLQLSLSSWVFSSSKLEWDGLALWQTGSMATHHQYLVVFCLFGAARLRWQLGDLTQASTDKGATWYAALKRILARARGYTLLMVIISQYDGISRGSLASGMVMLIVCRAYEMYYPWLVSVRSQQTCAEQMKRAMVDLLDDSVLHTDVLWPVPMSFCNATHTRLGAFRAHISDNYGIFLPSNQLLRASDNDDAPGSSIYASSVDQYQFICGWVDGSCLLSTGCMLTALFNCWGVVTARTSPFTWRLAGGILYLLCFCIVLFPNAPAFIYHLSKIAEKLISDSHENGRLMFIYSQEWWSETKRFLGVLVMSGLPLNKLQRNISVLGSHSGACFPSVVGRLEGLECAIYVLLAALMKLFTEALLCSAVLLLKRLRLGHPFLLLCQWLRTQVMSRLVGARALFPGLINSVAIDILRAETIMASQKTCLRSGLCVQALQLRQPGVMTRLESIIQEKGAIQETCSFFLCTRAASNEDTQSSLLEDPFLARAVALGLLEQAGSCLRKLKASRETSQVASFLQDLLRLVRVYAMDSYVPNEETREAMLGAARIVQEVVQEALEAHWQRYKNRERSVEANFCECVSEGEWKIMAAQVSVEMLVVYMGERMSSLEWSYKMQEALVLKDWITTRSTLINADAEVLLVH